MKKAFEIVCYFRSSSPDHRESMRLVREAMAQIAESSVTVTMKEVDADESALPEEIAALPCLHRLAPAPERMVIGMFENVEQVLRSVGFKKAEEEVRFAGWTAWG